ncbi:unnamed protein product [Parnassius apollo]|uniref:(apollo) hypothetical protein n=1 Tax=Parnassius apollo TaxID=110799 RepID=A0A8S3W1W9_PARAO|nr:unnamed protein product [Parnassius apollo]
MDSDKPRTRLRTENSKQLPMAIECSKTNKIFPLRFCMSCPTVDTSTEHAVTPEKLSHLKTRHVSLFTKLNTKHTSVTFLNNYPSNLMTSCVPQVACWRSYSKCCSPCSFPSCCGCLPPPCNEPPRCIQCMTGYYYYPYGYWFCGPYHVGGTCCPVGPSGICPPQSKCCPTAACVCPAAAAVVTQAVKACAKTKPISDQPFESPISEQKPQRLKNKTIKPESGVRKAIRPDLSKAIPIPLSTDANEKSSPKSAVENKQIHSTTYSSLCCSPCGFKGPLENPVNSVKADFNQMKVNYHSISGRFNSRLGYANYRAPINKRDITVHQKRCRYTGVMRPHTLLGNGKNDCHGIRLETYTRPQAVHETFNPYEL